MTGMNRKPRRRNLPILGMTSLGLAVGAGSLGLYRVAVAEPLPLRAMVQADDQPQWNTPTKPAAPLPMPEEGVVQATLQVPALPSLPPGAWPSLPSTGPSPVVPQLPALPMMPEPMMPMVSPSPIVVAPPSLPVAPIEVQPLLIVADPRETAPLPRPHPRLAVPTAAVPQSAQSEKMQLPVMPIQPVEPKFSLPVAPIPLSVTPTNPSAGVPAFPASSPGRPIVPTANDTAGELPMIPSFTTVKSAVMGLALATAPIQAATVPDKIPQADEKKPETQVMKKDPVEELKTALEAIRKEVAAERKERMILADEVLGKKSADGKTEAGLIQKVNEMDGRLKSIEALLLKLDGRMTELANAKSVTAQTPTVPNKDTAKEAAKDGAKEMPKEKPIVGPKAVLRLVNEYPVSVSMMVNDQSYRLEPGQIRLVDIKAGEFTYELLHSGAESVKMTVKENDTMTLRVR